MIANAGIIVAKPLLEVTVAEWDKVQAVSTDNFISLQWAHKVFQVNVRGMMLCYREAGMRLPNWKRSTAELISSS